MSTQKQTQWTKSLDALIGLGVIFSLVVGGFALLSSMHGPYLAEYQADHRFQTDNAAGAAANAVEHVARNYEPPSSAPQWFAVAILCLILHQLRLAVQIKGEPAGGPPPLKP